MTVGNILDALENTMSFEEYLDLVDILSETGMSEDQLAEWLSSVALQ